MSGTSGQKLFRWQIKEQQRFEKKDKLVGGFNPSEQIEVKLDHFPKVGVKVKNI